MEGFGILFFFDLLLLFLTGEAPVPKAIRLGYIFDNEVFSSERQNLLAKFKQLTVVWVKLFPFATLTQHTEKCCI